MTPGGVTPAKVTRFGYKGRVANGERRTFRAQSVPRWALVYLLAFLIVQFWPAHHGVRGEPVLDWMLTTTPLVFLALVLVYWRQATTVSWDGVTVRSALATKRYGWTEAYCFEWRERSFLGMKQFRAALRLTDGTLVPLTPRWSGYRERQLVNDMHVAAVWFRIPENRLALQAWIRAHPPKFHPLIAGRPVGPLLVGVGFASLAIAAAFPSLWCIRTASSIRCTRWTAPFLTTWRMPPVGSRRRQSSASPWA
jgi:Bacterial PH domain